MQNKYFLNPYKDEVKGGSHTYRLNARIPEHAFNRVKACRLIDGTIETTVTLLWQKLINELNKRGITDFNDQGKFESFLAECVFALPTELRGGTTPCNDGETPQCDDGRRTEGTSAKVAVSTPNNTDAKKESGSRGSGGGRGRGEKKAKKG